MYNQINTIIIIANKLNRQKYCFFSFHVGSIVQDQSGLYEYLLIFVVYPCPEHDAICTVGVMTNRLVTINKKIKKIIQEVDIMFLAFYRNLTYYTSMYCCFKLKLKTSRLVLPRHSIKEFGMAIVSYSISYPPLTPL